jgi:hypothetical protein
MRIQQRPTSRRHSGAALVFLGGVLAGVAARADEPNPYYIGASAGVTHNSNVFEQHGPQSDNYFSYGLLGGIDQMIGRQRVYAVGSMQANRYQTFDQLNHVSYDLTSGLDWATVERLSGTFRFNTSQGLVNYADANFVSPELATIRDLQRTQQLAATLRYGFTPGLAVDGGAERRTVDFSAPEDKRDYSENVVHAGLMWGSSEVLTLGIGGRLTRGDYPQAVISPVIPEVPPSPGVPGSPRIDATFGHDKTRRRDIDFTAIWSPRGAGVVNARISLTRETHSQPTIPTLSGVTGAISWDYNPGGRLSYKASLMRDTASETTFSNLQTAPVRVNNDSLTTSASFGAIYALTGKISLNADFRHDNGAVDSVDGTRNDSTTNFFGLGASYQVTRSIGASCSVSREQRQGSYSVNIASCSAQIVLR